MTEASQMARTAVAGIDVSTAHWIDGQRVPSNRTFEVFSPIDGSHLANVSAGGVEEANAAVASARRAFPAWAALGPQGRLPILKRFAECILAHRERIAAVETVDNGSLLSRNREGTIPRAAHNIDFFAEWAVKRRHAIIDSPTVSNHVRYDPSGVAVLITPWNNPFMLTTWKVGPALAAGNAIVIKPPEWAPLTCSLMADIAHEAGLPPGVLNVVQGIGEEVGAALASHENVDRISFTGSTDTARLIGQAAARTITPVSFELGGKSPFVVLGDADLDAAARTIAGQYNNAGQVCLAGTRILVEHSIGEDLLGRVRREVAASKVGDPRDGGTKIGPLIHPEAFERVTGFVERALADGARPLWGGERHALGGLYFQPTLLTDVRQNMEVAQQEVFGPVLTWQTFSDESELVEIANGTKYGLAAMLFTGNEKRAWRIADQLVAGSLWVNCFFVRDLAAPFGGSRNSGIGREGGDWSMDFYSDIKNVSILKGSLA